MLGFQRFLETIDVGRASPDDLHVVFNRYLPYTLALGLAKHWITRFAAAGVTTGHWFAHRTNSAADYLTFVPVVSSVTTSRDAVGSNAATSYGWSGGGGDGGGGGGVGSW